MFSSSIKALYLVSVPKLTVFINALCLIPPQELDQQKYIYTKGCVGQFEKWLQDNLIVVAGIFVGIALLQVRQCCFCDLSK